MIISTSRLKVGATLPAKYFGPGADGQREHEQVIASCVTKGTNLSSRPARRRHSYKSLFKRSVSTGGR